MNNFVDYLLPFSSQADADAVFELPLIGSMTLIHALVYQSAVAGSPTAVTLDVSLTDDTDTYTPIAAGSLGTSAGQTLLQPSAQTQFDGEASIEQESSPSWRAVVDFNFTGGTSPTTTGWLVLRFAH